MQRSFAPVWIMFAMSLFGLVFPHLAAGDVEEPGPLRLMALALFVLTGAVLVDHYLLGSAVFRSIASL